MKNFKSFSPKVDEKRRLVLTRFYTGVKDSNLFCYQITRITKNGSIDKRFKPLYAYGTDEFDSVKEFQHSGTGEKVKVFRKPFKSVFGVREKNNPSTIWKSTIKR
jgi:hypothetical protein